MQDYAFPHIVSNLILTAISLCSYYSQFTDVEAGAQKDYVTFQNITVEHGRAGFSDHF